MKQVDETRSKPAKRRPAMDPDARENQLISLAVDLAEERLRKGTASSAEVVHFLKMGSRKERLEREAKSKEIELLTAKTEAIKAAQNSAELYEKAIKAMQLYQGVRDDGTDV